MENKNKLLVSVYAATGLSVFLLPEGVGNVQEFIAWELIVIMFVLIAIFEELRKANDEVNE